MNKPCSIRDGRFLDICKTLDDCLNDPYSSRGKGINFQQYKNIETFEPTRDLVVFKMSAKDGGIVFNYCPFCGEKIFMRENENEVMKFTKEKNE